MPQAIDFSSCPETLVMDRERIVKFQNDLQLFTLVALQMNVVSQVLRDKQVIAHTTADDAIEMKDKLIQLLSTSGTTIKMISKEMNALVSVLCLKHNQTYDEKDEKLLESMIDKTSATNDPVYKLLSKRLLNLVRNYLTTSSSAMSQSALQAIGYGMLHGSVKEFAQQLQILIGHNYTVYAHYYNDIISQTVSQTAQELADQQ
eukprot:GFYU01004975.1.p1 GENE.GFYU01004975.1~~GFYU01004975.1.p1  ORF type:complete len:225 (-),score=69.30 GFYU01004975.1:3-611(-)